VTAHDALIDGWQAAWSGRDARAFGAVCAPAVQYEDPLSVMPLVGVAGLAGHAARLWAAFPDARLERTGQRLSDGRFIAAPCRLLGTQTAPLEDIPKTGRKVVLQVVFYCEVEGDRLRRVRAFFDLYDAARQLGVLPKGGGLGERALFMLRGFGLRIRER
jgi:steroid delta-isomerase-like uncharacterized protein